MAGGGIGEATLMSAVIGGGLSAAKGEDPLKGALLGGLMSGATGGIGNLLTPATAPAMAPGLGRALFGTAAEGALANPLAEGLLSTTVPAEYANAAFGAQNLVNNAGPGIQVADAFRGMPSSVTPEMLQQAGLASDTIPQALKTQHDQLVNAASQIPKEAVTSPGGINKLLNWAGNLSTPEKLLYGGTAALAAPAVMSMFKGKKELGDGKEEYDGPLKKFKYDPSRYTPLEVTPPTPYQPVYKDYRNYAGGGAIEAMSNANAVGANTGYPMANIPPGAYATPYQQPISRNVLTGSADTGVNPMTGEMQFVRGGIANLGRYSDYASGGRMLKGPGDGMSDDIPATIAGKQPARLANEEFVVPADVVSHLGNGSSEAGAKQLYKMMERVRKARTGNKKQGKQINPERYLA
jgi:hypothetical protein